MFYAETYSVNNTFIGNTQYSSLRIWSYNNVFRNTWDWSTPKMEFQNNLVLEPMAYLDLGANSFNNTIHASGNYVFRSKNALINNTLVLLITYFEVGRITYSGLYLIGGISNGFRLELCSGSLVGYWNGSGVTYDAPLTNTSLHLRPDSTNTVADFAIRTLLPYKHGIGGIATTTIGGVRTLGVDPYGSVIDATDYVKGSPIGAISRFGNGGGSVYLGGFLMEPTSNFRGFNGDQSFESTFNSFSSHTYPFGTSTPNASLFNMKTVLVDKVLFVTNTICVVLNSDGSIYKVNNKPWVYRGATRNFLLTDTHVFLVSNFNSTFFTYDENFIQVAVPNKTTMIKVDLLSGEVDPVFTFNTVGNTYANNIQDLARVCLVDNNTGIFFKSTLLRYLAEEQGFYMHVISTTTGELNYSNKLSNGAIGFCTDAQGCGTTAYPMGIGVDSQNRLYMSYPMTQYNLEPSVPWGRIRAIFRFNLNVANPPGNNISFQIDTAFAINFAYTGSQWDGFNILFITSDDNVIIATTEDDVLEDVTIIDGPPIRSIM
jgi:hypothetical protein